MALKTYNPTSPGQRHVVLVDRNHLWKGAPVKLLTEGLIKTGGRGNLGRITSRRKGGGHKRAYRLVDFKRDKFDVPATVERLEYDPNRTAYIALIKYSDGEQAYILAPQRLTIGDTVMSGRAVDVKPGNAMPLSAMPVGTIVHNIETKPGKGGQLARAAGTYAMFAGRDQGYALSSSNRARPAWCAPNAWRRSVRSRIPTMSTRSSARPGGRAGGCAPDLRGIARNPSITLMAGVPMAASIGRRRWGKPTKGKKTRSQQGDAEIHPAQPSRPRKLKRSVPCHARCGKARSSTGIS